MTLTVLVTGAGGQLGRELLRQGIKAKFRLIPAERATLDITAAAQVQAAVERFKPFVVINAAAYTQVDKAESEARQAFRVNADGAANLARACRLAGVVLIHISTDYVFDGNKGSLYTEADPVAPRGVYARSKAEGEAQVRSILREHVIVRTGWLYSPYGHNFVKTMLRLGREKRMIDVVDDQFGSPTSAAHLGRAILKVIAAIRRNAAVAWGTYHYCGRGVVSRHAFAEKIFNLIEPYHLFERPIVRAVSSALYPTPAPRPRFSALDCSRIRERFNILPAAWSEGLAAAIEDSLQSRRGGIPP